MKTIQAYVYKFWLKPFELFGRLFLFNWFPPSVGDVICGVRYGKESQKQSLDVVIPEGKPPFPVMVYVHGGAFHCMDKKSYRHLSRYFASKGYLVFNINYRMAPRHRFPAGLQDVGAAVKWADDFAGRYGGDSSRMFLAGDSAGAYFASMYAAATQSPGLMSSIGIEEGIPPEHLKGLVLFYGAYDMETILDTGFPLINFVSHGFFGYDPRVYSSRAEIASPRRHITSSFPSAFVTSGERDSLHPESVEFERALTEAGIPHRTLFFTRKEHPFAYTWHGFASVPFLKCSRIARKEACAFLDEIR